MCAYRRHRRLVDWWRCLRLPTLLWRTRVVANTLRGPLRPWSGPVATAACQLDHPQGQLTQLALHLLCDTHLRDDPFCARRQCCNFADARRLFWYFSNCCACEVQSFKKRRGRHSCVQRARVVGQAESTTSEVAGTRPAVLSTVEVTARTLCKGVVRRVVAKKQGAAGPGRGPSVLVVSLAVGARGASSVRYAVSSP